MKYHDILHFDWFPSTSLLMLNENSETAFSDLYNWSDISESDVWSTIAPARALAPGLYFMASLTKVMQFRCIHFFYTFN